MRSLLFQHEAKAKRVAKIKSKTFHRLDKDRKMRNFKDTDEEAVKEAALKQEASRVEVYLLTLYLRSWSHGSLPFSWSSDIFFRADVPISVSALSAMFCFKGCLSFL